MTDLSSWEDFRKTFEMPVLISLLGAVTGHYGKTNAIKMFTIGFPYKKGTYLQDAKGLKKILRWLYILGELALHTFGLRFGANREEVGIWIYPGFLGDMLVGVGTGILAKSALSMASPSSNDFAVISASFLAGFAGLTFIRTQQAKGLNTTAKSMATVLDGIEDEPTVEEELKTEAVLTKNQGMNQIRDGLQQVASTWERKTTIIDKKNE